MRQGRLCAAPAGGRSEKVEEKLAVLSLTLSVSLCLEDIHRATTVIQPPSATAVGWLLVGRERFVARFKSSAII